MALSLSSPEFEDGASIPRRFGYEAANVNPPLELSGVPADAESLAIVVDDPDAKAVTGTIWDHWVVWNVPPDRTTIPADWDPATDGAEQGQNDYGERRYGGPNPPNETHEYRFQVFALDATLDLPADSSAEELRTAMNGHVLDEAELYGTYAP